MKIKINKELSRIFDVWDITKFEESHISEIQDWVVKKIYAPRFYEEVKKLKIKKSKFYFNSMQVMQVFKDEMNIIEMIDHYIRIDNCDTSIPIIVHYNWRIYDWIHRVMKAILEWKTWIRCYRYWNTELEYE